MGDTAQGTEQIAETQATPVQRKGIFRVGHPKYGGRKKGAPLKRTREAREIAERLGFDVVEFLIRAAGGTMLNLDGTETVLTTDQRLDAGKAVAPYLRPKLSAQTISGPNEGPIELARANTEIERVMATPEGVEAAQKLALLIAGDGKPAPQVVDATCEVIEPDSQPTE
jgi:hypothetical protein